MNALNMMNFIQAKTDQLNSEDLIGGPMTVTISRVSANESAPEQPINISFEGDDGKPYRPCKSMRRVMVHVWGPEATHYVGRRMTLYRDPDVAFGGMKVGGVRISHMSHIDREKVFPLSTTRGKFKQFTVQPLKTAPSPRETAPSGDDRGRPGPEAGGDNKPALTLSQRADMCEKRIWEALSTTKLTAIWNAATALRTDLENGDPERLVELEATFNARFMAVEDEERGAA